jgi:hypothetical protein
LLLSYQLSVVLLLFAAVISTIGCAVTVRVARGLLLSYQLLVVLLLLRGVAFVF